MALVTIAAALGYSLAPIGAHRPARAAVRMADTPVHAQIVFLRHGQSIWNEASLFTGWADVPLTTLGKNEAAAGATQMWKEGIKIDVAFTSLLTRAQQTLDIVLRITGQEDVPVHQNWRLNERMCTRAPPPICAPPARPTASARAAHLSPASSASAASCRWRADGPE